MSKAPRILIFGQPFSEVSGGGITLTNLFKGWPKDRLASTFIAWDSSSFDPSLCDNYYLIGRTEHRWIFPLNLIKRPFPESGYLSAKGEPQKCPASRKPFFRKSLSDIINPILSWLGVYNVASKVALSESQKTWISIFKPELLYLQVSTLEGIDFAHQLIEFCSVPVVLHMMDDWPSTLGRNIFLSNYWNKRVHNEFVNLLNRIDLCLVISDAMAREYNKRYGRICVTFHNPVSIDKESRIDDIVSNPDALSFRILYVGRIGTANRHSIISFAKAISGRKSHGKEIEFVLYSKDINESYLKSIKKLRAVHLYNSVQHNQIPGLLSDYDLLLLPLDFTAKGLRFAKFSMPTKVAEYMVSGTPILVFAPEETAISKFFIDNDCGFTLARCNPSNIHATLDAIIGDQELRTRLSNNANRIAKEKFAAEKVRHRFQATLLQLIEKRTDHE